MRRTIRLATTLTTLCFLFLASLLTHYRLFRWSIPPQRSLAQMDSEYLVLLFAFILAIATWTTVAVFGRRSAVFSLLALLTSMAFLAFPSHFYLLVNYPWYKAFANIDLMQFTLLNNQIHYVGASLGLLVLIAVGYARLSPSRDLE